MQSVLLRRHSPSLQSFRRASNPVGSLGHLIKLHELDNQLASPRKSGQFRVDILFPEFRTTALRLGLSRSEYGAPGADRDLFRPPQLGLRCKLCWLQRYGFVDHPFVRWEPGIARP